MADDIGRSDIAIKLETVATGLAAPNWATSAPGQPDILFVTDQVGIVWAVDLISGDKTVFLDMSADIVPLGFLGAGTFDERGLLGLAFRPDYASNGKFYTYSSEPDNGVPDFLTPDGAADNHHSVISEWIVANPEIAPTAGSANTLANPASKRELMRVGQPQFNHDGGALNFGPIDGMLYISRGDGGAANDAAPGHTPDIGNGQDTSNVLGAILQIDVDGNDSNNSQYGVPAGNAGEIVPEIYAYGFRNPFRFSIDDNGDLWVGDIGQNDIEEVDVVTGPGGNYGWNVKEGTFCFDVDAKGGYTHTSLRRF